MSETWRKRLVYLSFVVVATWGVFNLTEDKEDVLYEEPSAIRPASIGEAPTVNRALIDIEQCEAQAWGDDPFRSLRPHLLESTQAEECVSAWTLSGILYSKDNPLAYVNGQSVARGDVVDGAEVISIERKSITLEYRGSQFTISVNKG